MTKTEVKAESGAGGFWIFLALMVIFTWGEPDLLDALIHYFMVK